MKKQRHESAQRFNRLMLAGAGIALAAVLSVSSYLAATAATTTVLPISQVPLTVSMPAHPQVLIAIGNSESMDGTLSGAIMTGSGTVPSGATTLTNSSSPVSYQVPTGFTPPVQVADASGNAPYTVSQNGVMVDNGASRLNVAKAGIKAVIQQYMQNTDFAMETYNTSNTSTYNTWVYYMSPPGGFVFTSNKVTGNRYVANPCYGYTSASSTVKSNCTSIAGAHLYTSTAVSSSLYMQIASSSDDPDINDVLYASNQPAVFVNYNNPNPPTSPYTQYTLANYNAGSVSVTYSNSVPSANKTTSPTNAGFVPFTLQTMYTQRGFGYGGSQSATTGNMVVPLQSSGATPTVASVTAAVNKFLPYLSPETNSASSTEIKAVAGQAPTAALLTTANSYLSGITKADNGCPPTQYVVLISDGLPTEDMNGKFWPPLGSAAAQGYGVTATFNADGSLGTTNDQALTDTVNALTQLKAKGIKTFVIGLGAGVNPALNPQAASTLTAMAVAGGTGQYYAATDPTAFTKALNSIMVSIQSGNLDTTAAAVSSTRLSAGSDAYQASFNPNSSPYQDWTGDLTEVALDPVTGLPTGNPIWSAQKKLDALSPSSRVIATWNPSTAAGVPFEWTNLSTAQQALLQPADTAGQSRLNYLRGVASGEQRNGGTFRNRSHLLGDIANSQPVYVGPPSDNYFSSSYTSFANTKANRTSMIYVGANDGMLHAFNAATGVEQFAFVPNGVFANLQNLTAPIYNQSHLFYVDGSPQSSDVQFTDGSWHTLLIGGEGAGGRSIYALDVTDPQNLTTEAALASAVLWEFTDSDMGLSFSEPVTGMVASPSRFAVFFGNGYNSANNNAVLYAVDPKTGQVIRKIDLCSMAAGSCDATLPQGLSSVALANIDGLSEQPVTNVYAGDLQGNVWSIDVSSANPASWTAKVLFKARDGNNVIQPITMPPVVTLHPNYPSQSGLFVMIGTGQLLTSTDLASQQTQSVYGVWDKLGGTTPVTRANLQKQTLSDLGGGELGATFNSVDWSTKYGWYMDFNVAGERVVTKLALDNGAFKATLNTPPQGGGCTGGFTSALLELNYQTGGSFGKPQFDVNQDGVIDSGDLFNGRSPAGISLGSGYASTPVNVGINKNGKQVDLITKSDGKATKMLNQAGSAHHVGWFQVE